MDSSLYIAEQAIGKTGRFKQSLKVTGETGRTRVEAISLASSCVTLICTLIKWQLELRVNKVAAMILP